MDTQDTASSGCNCKNNSRCHSDADFGFGLQGIFDDRQIVRAIGGRCVLEAPQESATVNDECAGHLQRVASDLAKAVPIEQTGAKASQPDAESKQLPEGPLFQAELAVQPAT